jgi:hypothetical protein
VGRDERRVRLNKWPAIRSKGCFMNYEIVQQVLSGLIWLLLVADLGLIGGAFLIEVARDL